MRRTALVLLSASLVTSCSQARPVMRVQASGLELSGTLTTADGSPSRAAALARELKAFRGSDLGPADPDSALLRLPWRTEAVPSPGDRLVLLVTTKASRYRDLEVVAPGDDVACGNGPTEQALLAKDPGLHELADTKNADGSVTSFARICSTPFSQAGILLVALVDRAQDTDGAKPTAPLPTGTEGVRAWFGYDHVDTEGNHHAAWIKEVPLTRNTVPLLS